MTNRLYYGDNLDVLRRYVKDETVDLVWRASVPTAASAAIRVNSRRFRKCRSLGPRSVRQLTSRVARDDNLKE